MKANLEIRKQLMINKIPYWVLAEAAGLSENTVYRWMRTELTEERRKVVETAIETILAIRESGNND